MVGYPGLPAELPLSGNATLELALKRKSDPRHSESEALSWQRIDQLLDELLDAGLIPSRVTNVDLSRAATDRRLSEADRLKVRELLGLCEELDKRPGSHEQRVEDRILRGEGLDDAQRQALALLEKGWEPDEFRDRLVRIVAARPRMTREDLRDQARGLKRAARRLNMTDDISKLIRADLLPVESAQRLRHLCACMRVYGLSLEKLIDQRLKAQGVLRRTPIEFGTVDLMRALKAKGELDFEALSLVLKWAFTQAGAHWPRLRQKDPDPTADAYPGPTTQILRRLFKSEEARALKLAPPAGPPPHS
jgi:hypothetical protein